MQELGLAIGAIVIALGGTVGHFIGGEKGLVLGAIIACALISGVALYVSLTGKGDAR